MGDEFVSPIQKKSAKRIALNCLQPSLYGAAYVPPFGKIRFAVVPKGRNFLWEISKSVVNFLCVNSRVFNWENFYVAENNPEKFVSHGINFTLL
jgi:hypothetical protein